MPRPSFEKWTLEELIAGCRDEATWPREEEEGMCIALVIRAVTGDGTEGWTAVQQQYHRLVRNWVRRAATDPLLPGELDDLLQETWLRFWHSLRGRDEPLHRQFPHIGTLLRYLHQCAVTAVLDQGRTARRRADVDKLVQGEPEEFAGQRPRAVVDQVADRLQKEARLEQVRAWIDQRVDDPLEQLVLRESFVNGLDPIEIAARHPDHFANVHEVRKVKERLIKRMRRALKDQN